MSAETAAVSTAAHVGRAAELKRRSGGSGRSRSKNSGAASIGALRGVPAGMGRARRRLDCGERRFPGCGTLNADSYTQPFFEFTDVVVTKHRLTFVKVATRLGT